MLSCFKLRKLRKELKEVRLAAARRLISDDDILSDDKKTALRAIVDEASAVDRSDAVAIRAFVDSGSVRLNALSELHGNKRKLRNILDVLAVAFAVAFGIRALYLQPFKIPTSSMQPTLFGIHYVDRKGLAEHSGVAGNLLKIPYLAVRPAYLKIGEDGSFRAYQPTRELGIFDLTVIQIGDRTYTLPGTINQIARYLDLERRIEFRKDEVPADGWLSTGDHLFVDRVSIHYLPPRRGDVIVFTTENIKSPTQPLGGYYYIKRLVGLPGDTLKIVDRMLYIKPEGAAEFRPATAFSDKFKRLYSMEGGYQGHIASELLGPGLELKVPENMYFALGDNTANSLDGRNWGFIPRKNMIGRALNIFWPLSRRWGFVDTKPALSGKTVLPDSMGWQ